VKILTPPLEGELSIANPKLRVSNHEFVITEKTFNEYLSKEVISWQK
jgi:hypothetical protein